MHGCWLQLNIGLVSLGSIATKRRVAVGWLVGRRQEMARRVDKVLYF